MTDGSDRSDLSSLASFDSKMWLKSAGIHDAGRGMTNLTSILQSRVAADVLQKLLDQLQTNLVALERPRYGAQ